MLEPGWLAAGGIALGLLLSLGAATLLFGVRSWDLPTLAVVTGGSIVASFVPARRAASIQPVEALRTE